MRTNIGSRIAHWEEAIERATQHHRENLERRHKRGQNRVDEDGIRNDEWMCCVGLGAQLDDGEVEADGNLLREQHWEKECR
jgi:hypothetical protein